MAVNAFAVSGEPVMVPYTPGSAVAAGDVVVVGVIPMVAHVDIAANKLGALAAMGGVYQLTAAGNYAAGTRVYWDNSAKKVTTTATSNKGFGFTAEAASGDGALVRVVHLPWIDTTA